jgi:hypothetical protein
MMYPNLVIAGAPKCGTSSLYHWLADHPEACGSSVKETFYLMDEGHPLLRKDSNFHTDRLEGYRAFFDGERAENSRIVFEATTHYIYQRTPVEVLSKLSTPPQVVFVLRKPSERIYSSFQYSQNNLANVKRDVSFARFVELLKKETGNEAFGELAGASAYVLGNDIRYSRYVEYLAFWVERFGRERVHILLFEDMKADPPAFMQDLARRFRVDPAFYDDYDFPLRNETFKVRYQKLHRGARKLNELVPTVGLKGALKRVYLKAQAGKSNGHKTPEDMRALAQLEREFRPFNQRLADEFGLDLSAWE